MATSIMAATRDLYRVALATYGRQAFEEWAKAEGRPLGRYDQPASVWPSRTAPAVLADLSAFLAERQKSKKSSKNPL